MVATIKSYDRSRFATTQPYSVGESVVQLLGEGFHAVKEKDFSDDELIDCGFDPFFVAQLSIVVARLKEMSL